MNPKPQRRPQRQKASKVQQVQDLRRGNAAQPHKLATDYRRRPKHGFEYEEDDDDIDFTWR